MIFYRFVLYTSKKLSDGTSPVMLQASHNRVVKRISTGLKGTPKEWDENRQRFKKEKLKNYRLDELWQFAQMIVFDLQREKKMALDEFIRRLKNENTSYDVLEFFDERIKEELNAGKIGNAEVYKHTRNVIRRFHGDHLLFSQVDYKFLDALENDLRQRGATDGGISNYMRTIRAIYNKAIKRGRADRDTYPFANGWNRNGYEISKLKPKLNPKPLSPEELEKVKSYSGDLYKEAYLICMFSYYTFGMNYADIARLTKENIHEDILVYLRHKTKVHVKIPIHPEARKIIDQFNGERYLFPILSDFHQSELQIFYRIQKMRKQYNKELKKLSQQIGISINLTSYTSRYSVTNKLLREGRSTKSISQSMGQKNESSLRHYEEMLRLDEISKNLQYV